MVQVLNNKHKLTLFHELLLSVLLYSVVLGFFNDYTNIISTQSYSTTFLTALALSLLIYPTFMLKSFLVRYFKERNQKVALVMTVWAVLFVSKFVFLWILDLIFGNYLDISGFVGLLIIILVATILQKIVDYFYQKFGKQTA
ncbi:MAG: hypothetical protein WCI63_03440 [bacterium]